MGKEHKTGRVNPNKAGMYFSLCICILALAIGAFSAVTRKNELYNSNAVTTQSVVEIRKNQTDVKKQTTTKKIETTKASTTAKPSEKTTSVTSQTTTARVVANHFVMPVGGTLKKEFSNNKLVYSETYSDWRIHDGIDINAKKGTDVLSAGKGRVKKVYTDEKYGKTVVIDHGNGVVCYYCGLKSIRVAKDDVLEISQKIGVIDEIPSEIADETHLHFSVEKDGKKVDPIKELELNQ